MSDGPSHELSALTGDHVNVVDVLPASAFVTMSLGHSSSGGGPSTASKPEQHGANGTGCPVSSASVLRCGFSSTKQNSPPLHAVAARKVSVANTAGPRPCSPIGTATA